jgi:dTDP-4-dehydrorhamnose reductase
VYGKTKLGGEEAIRASGVPHLILRTAWVYSTQGRNFPLTILRLATEREELRVVRDQFGAPTWSRDIAEVTVKILTQLTGQRDATLASVSQASGTYHLTAAGETTWYDFACAILEEAAHLSLDVSWFAEATCERPLITTNVIPITTVEHPTPASRPAHSVLSNSRLKRTFGLSLPDWRTQLRLAFRSERVTATGGFALQSVSPDARIRRDIYADILKLSSRFSLSPRGFPALYIPLLP